MCGPSQPPSWELPEASDYPNVSDDESEGDEVNIGGDRPVSLSETRKEMEERMEKKVGWAGVSLMTQMLVGGGGGRTRGFHAPAVRPFTTGRSAVAAGSIDCRWPTVPFLLGIRGSKRIFLIP